MEGEYLDSMELKRKHGSPANSQTDLPGFDEDSLWPACMDIFRLLQPSDGSEQFAVIP